MSVQAISGSTVSQYQPLQPTAQNDSQPTAQGASGQKVKKGGGHHHRPSAPSTGNAKAASATDGASAPLTASAVSGVGYSQSTSDAATDSGSTIDILA
jgi:hypothetical protein